MKMNLTRKPSERGQSFVELGISLIFLLTLLCGTMDLGWALYTMTAMRDTVQEAAGFAAMCQNMASIEKRMKSSASAPLNINDIQNFSIQYLDASGNTGGSVNYGSKVKVSLTVQHKIVTPFVGSFIGTNGKYPLTVNATDAVMQLATDCH